MGSKQSGKHQGSNGVSYVQNLFLACIILYDELIITVTIFLEVKIHLVGGEFTRLWENLTTYNHKESLS